MTALLDVQDLKTSFFTARGEVQAVRGVSFHVRPGETLGIVGESGSGKSITCMSLLRLLKGTGRVIGGAALFEGRDLLQLDEDDLRDIRGNQIAVIFQDPMTSLNPTLSVGDQVMEVILRHRNLSRSEARLRAIELFELVKIPSAATRLKSYPHEFSGGMRQRVMIAIALACDPKLLIADEPTTALDVTVQAEILNLIKALKEKTGMAVILITHDLTVVRQFADYVYVMQHGLVREEGPTETVFTDPQHPYTRRLLGSEPKGTADPLPGETETVLEGRDIRVTYALRRGGAFRGCRCNCNAGKHWVWWGNPGLAKPPLARRCCA